MRRNLRGQSPSLSVEREKDLDLAAQHVGIDRLEKEIDGAGTVAAKAVGLGLMHRGDENDRHVPRLRVLARVAGDLIAVHLRHLHVEQHHRERVAEQHAKRLVAIIRAEDLAVEIAELRFERDQVGLGIVDEQDARACLGHRPAWMVVLAHSAVDTRSCIERREGYLAARELFARAQAQKPAWTKAARELDEHPRLQRAVEVDEDVAAKHDLHLAEDLFIGDEIVPKEAPTRCDATSPSSRCARTPRCSSDENSCVPPASR